MSAPVSQIRMGDVGTSFRFEIVDASEADQPECNFPIVDVSEASTLQIIFEKPDGTVSTKTATFVTSGEDGGTDGLIEYVTESGFLDQAGIWRRQARVVLGGNDWRTPIVCFEVFANIV